MANLMFALDVLNEIPCGTYGRKSDRRAASCVNVTTVPDFSVSALEWIITTCGWVSVALSPLHSAFSLVSLSLCCRCKKNKRAGSPFSATIRRLNMSRHSAQTLRSLPHRRHFPGWLEPNHLLFTRPTGMQVGDGLVPLEMDSHCSSAERKAKWRRTQIVSTWASE